MKLYNIEGLWKFALEIISAMLYNIPTKKKEIQNE